MAGFGNPNFEWSQTIENIESTAHFVDEWLDGPAPDSFEYLEDNKNEKNEKEEPDVEDEEEEKDREGENSSLEDLFTGPFLTFKPTGHFRPRNISRSTCKDRSCSTQIRTILLRR